MRCYKLTAAGLIRLMNVRFCIKQKRVFNVLKKGICSEHCLIINKEGFVKALMNILDVFYPKKELE